MPSRCEAASIRRSMVVVAVVGFLLPPALALGWQATLGGFATSVKLDAIGHIVAGGGGPGSPLSARVAKFAGPTGLTLWDRVIDDVRPFGHRGMTLDGSGNVILSSFSPASAPTGGFVSKLSGAMGATIWERNFPAGCGPANVVAVDAAGDVLVAGTVQGVACDYGVVKLSGSDGSELWRYSLAGSEQYPVTAMAIDANGNAVVEGLAARQLTVAKLAAADGSELWRQI